MAIETILGIAPHEIGGDSHSPSTLADLNTKVSDATLDDASDPRDPNTHAASHQDGGSDEVATVTPAANAIPKALAGASILDPNWTAVANVIEVAKDGTGQFTSVKAAVDSITDASLFKPYIVSVASGIYVEDPIAMKEYVSIIGRGPPPSAAIQANDNSSHLITGNINSSITNMQIAGPTDPGKASIYFDKESTTDRQFQVSNCQLISGYYGILVTGTTNPVNLLVSGLSWIAGTATRNVIRATGTARLVAIGIFIDTSVVGSMIAAIHVAGPADAALSTVDVDVAGLPAGLYCEAGAKVTASPVRIQNATNGLHIGAAAGSNTLTLNSAFLINCTKSIFIESADALVAFTGSADKETLDVNPAADFTAIFADDTPGEAGQVVVGELFAGPQTEQTPLVSLSRAISSTGVVSGGIVTRATGLTVDVTAGVGFIRTPTGVTEVPWDAVTGLAVPANEEAVYIYVDATGTVTAGAIDPNHENVMTLAALRTGASDITALSQHKLSVVQREPNFHEYIKAVIGNVVVSGTIAAISSPPSAQIAVGGGNWFNHDQLLTSTGADPITFTYWYRDGVGGWTVITGQTNSDPANYDDGSGTLAAVPAGKYTKDLLFLIEGGDGTEFHVVYASEYYDTENDATNGAIPTPPPLIGEHGLRLAGIVLQQGVTNIVAIADEHIRFGAASSPSSGTSDHNALSNLTVGDPHTQYQLESQKDVANGYVGLTAGSKISNGAFQVYGDTVDTAVEGNNTRVPTQDENDALAGTDGTPSNANRYVTDSDPRNTNARTPTAHASTHLPSGGDPLTTAVPVNVTKAANAEGVAESFARSDHKHDVTTAAPAATGVATASGEGAATSLARSDHTHQANTAPANVTKAAAVIGTSGEPARADHKHDVDTAAPSTAIGTTTVNAEGVAATLARSDHSHEVNVSTTQVTSTTPFTTSSLTDVLITGMTITPGAGTYLAIFSGATTGDGGGKLGIFSIYANGVQQAHSERVVNDTKAKNGSTIALVTVAAGQAIEARGRGGDTLGVGARSLTLIRVD